MRARVLSRVNGTLLCRLGVWCEAFVDRRDALAQLLERLVDIDLLPLQHIDALGEFLARVHELHITAIVAVEVENLADFREREADAAPAQDQDDAGAIALRIDARLAAPLGRDQALVLISEPQRSRGDAEFLGELANGEGAIGNGHFLPFAGLGVFAPLRPSL